jgi:hypothetical protein
MPINNVTADIVDVEAYPSRPNFSHSNHLANKCKGSLCLARCLWTFVHHHCCYAHLVQAMMLLFDAFEHPFPLYCSASVLVCIPPAGWTHSSKTAVVSSGTRGQLNEFSLIAAEPNTNLSFYSLRTSKQAPAYCFLGLTHPWDPHPAPCSLHAHGSPHADEQRNEDGSTKLLSISRITL